VCWSCLYERSGGGWGSGVGRRVMRRGGCLWGGRVVGGGGAERDGWWRVVCVVGLGWLGEGGFGGGGGGGGVVECGRI